MRHSILSPAVLVMAVLPLAACSIDVKKHDSGRSADVDIRTPTGTLEVRTSVPAEGTGLAVYPDAWPARKHGRDESADVDIDTAWFGVKVVAANFESDDDPAKVVAFYRNEMARSHRISSAADTSAGIATTGPPATTARRERSNSWPASRIDSASSS